MSAQKWENGEVRWFNDLSGEGSIRCEDGTSYYVHYSTINSKEKRKTLYPKDRVEFKLSNDPYMLQITEVRKLTRK